MVAETKIMREGTEEENGVAKNKAVHQHPNTKGVEHGKQAEEKNGGKTTTEFGGRAEESEGKEEDGDERGTPTREAAEDESRETGGKADEIAHALALAPLGSATKNEERARGENCGLGVCAGAGGEDGGREEKG